MTKHKKNKFKRKNTQEEMINSLAKRYEKVVSKINGLVNDVRDRVSSVDSLNLLHRGYFCNAKVAIGKKSESEYSAKDGIAARMVDYIQSVITSTDINAENPEIDNAAWEELRDSVEKLFFTLNGEYSIVRTAWKQINIQDYNYDIDRLLVLAQWEWVSVRGKRYDIHESQHLVDFLTPHDEVFQQLFGIPVNEFIRGMERVKHSLTFGFFDQFREMIKIRKMVEEEMGNRTVSNENNDAVIAEIIKDNGLGGQIAALQENLQGYGLFNVSTISGLPAPLLRELSWQVGENQEFFAPGQYLGWPFRELPIMSRPFIWVKDEAYCFDTFFLDNIYRSVQKLILKLRPDYKETWNNRQKKVSEKVPIELLNRIWPTAIRYGPVYYRWHAGSPPTMQWCECDGLLLYDDHILVIEIKAGAFSHTSPAIDPDGFIASIKNLAEKPAQQGRRFVEYFNSADEVEIFDQNHENIGKLQRNAFRNVTICCVTLDDFTTFAARIENLIPFGININDPVWCISIDNLRVYADIFKSATTFSHYLEERKKAFLSSAIDLDDELDHLGLYLEHNDYATTAEEIGKKRKATVLWHGYRDEIDAYYHDLLEGKEDATLPSQKLPERLVEIIKFLDSEDRPGRCKIASVILGMNEKTRSEVNEKLEEVLRLQSEKMRMFPTTVLLGQTCLTFFCKQMKIMCLNRGDMLEQAVKSLLCTNGEESLVIIVEYDDNLNANSVDFEYINKHEIPKERLELFYRDTELLKKQRWEKWKQLKRSVGRNERCPCGSGKKYKYCCLRTT